MTAAMELKDLSSNWKKLQKTLQTERKSANPTNRYNSTSNELKRKRTSNGNDRVSHTSKGVNSVRSHKRIKMEEPPTIGASKKQHEELARAISMPHLKTSSSLLLKDPAMVAEPISVLTPSPDHPDIENEGLSRTALPGKYVALDCEMVGIGPEPENDSQLARVSVVNFHGHQVYDSYVLPVVPVTDYRTPVSGILPRHLDPKSARPFTTVQRDIAKILQGRLLVAHAVKNDLSALILTHPKRDIRDTCRYPEFRKYSAGRTPALKKLVQELLGVEIQSGWHSSVEDARATMALFRLEKDGFEKETLRRYGRPVEAKPAELEDGEDKLKKKKKKKKKKAKK